MQEILVKTTSAMTAVEEIQSLRETFERGGLIVEGVMLTTFKVHSPVGIYVYSYKNNGIYAKEVRS